MMGMLKMMIMITTTTMIAMTTRMTTMTMMMMLTLIPKIAAIKHRYIYRNTSMFFMLFMLFMLQDRTRGEAGQEGARETGDRASQETGQSRRQDWAGLRIRQRRRQDWTGDMTGDRIGGGDLEKAHSVANEGQAFVCCYWRPAGARTRYTWLAPCWAAAGKPHRRAPSSVANVSWRARASTA